MNASMTRTVEAVTKIKVASDAITKLLADVAAQLVLVRQELKDQGVTNAKLDELSTTLETEAQEITDAVVANTPVEPA